jgi:osmotically inducible lipoprotein OsmB
MNSMNVIYQHAGVALALVLALSLSACSGMSKQEKNTAYGATAGGVAGAVITGGSTLGTLGGAAVGGLIGHEIDKDDKRNK